jgi:hypothetical protein
MGPLGGRQYSVASPLSFVCFDIGAEARWCQKVLRLLERRNPVETQQLVVPGLLMSVCVEASCGVS